MFIDPINSIKMAENIKNAMVKKDSSHKKYYEKNFEELKSQLTALDQDFKTLMNKSDKKEILVSHAAYGYWEKRYGLIQIPISGLSPSNEPTQKQLQQIIDLSKKHHIRYVLFEDNVKPRVADPVKSEVGAEALSFHNMESPAQKDIESKEDYISLMEKNLTIPKKVLQ
ncbi:metal ABC transporter solute-binding protein, Zn/Mn family [Fictibacillus sp. FJAT-27399]|uniref:metal ABC transporter solute-binding protein, Zn/Mn family n=1 Tax=Fictibacillus sp. FJAT-27399 TaxID=1729689 RepID=UPI0007835CAE|nr:zinc ABC transporter substrate-binding protein [Fictibacillus sp. FJAT-27399]